MGREGLISKPLLVPTWPLTMVEQPRPFLADKGAAAIISTMPGTPPDEPQSFRYVSCYRLASAWGTRH